MESISEFLSADHRVCDNSFGDAEESVNKKDWPKAKTLTTEYIAKMLHHLKMEEEVLFPAFEEETGNNMGPTAVMRAEHEQMRDLFSQLDAALEVEDKASYLDASETLLVMMQQHNMKEEQMLYPMSDEALGDTVDGLINRMKEV